MSLRGRVKFPTGGKVRERLRLQNWCDSNTDSIVWMKEDEKCFLAFLRFCARIFIIRAFIFLEV